MKGKQIEQKILMIGISVFIALVIAEVALRLFYSNKDVLCVFPPNLHYEFDPDSSIIHGVYGKKNFDTDRMGIRKFDSSDPDEYEILFIGGSTTECLYLDNKETWPYLLSKKLGLKGGSIGKSGQTSYDHYMQMKYFVPQLKKVKTVVVMCGLNDMLKALANIDSLDKIPYAGDTVREFNAIGSSFTHTSNFASAKGLRLTGFLKNIWRKLIPDTAGQYIQDKRGLCYKSWRQNRNSADSTIEKIEDGFADSDWPHYLVTPQDEIRFNINTPEIIKLAKKNNIRLIFVGQIAAWKDRMSLSDMSRLWMGGKGDFQKGKGHPYYSLKLLASKMSDYNQSLKRLCDDAGIPFIDISNFPTDIDHLYDDCHFTERGARELADSIYAHWPK